ncbi:hypothetical protein SAMN04489719_0157 [Agrococcus carbonis]|uniref:Acetone carboxylase n=2 Tax=Agrococcus carbonis TaxID=684552 RepID=A0A1H1KVV0_9MICO|nr:hypothetical protein [Agrococcus carbonis]SDR66160.1 hypothetical protein SAMN04489719_0157 [Agrococcus carbonis]
MLDGGSGEARCSASGCGATAAHALHWRNPRIHSADRVKTWAACDEHRETLAAWLRSRGFPVTATAFGETVERIA